jgi:dTDP-4-dehydrorhamnose reductase
MTVPPILVIGGSGQLARALARIGAVGQRPIVCRGRPAADLADASSLSRVFDDVSPFAVVNAGAYTGVDQAEDERELAFAVNGAGPQVLARLCRERSLPLIHISTDYVFDGAKREPYVETDAIAPLGAYGASKAAGEEAIRSECPHHLILRTSWLYSLDGRNFLTTMLRLGASRDELAIVDDQLGSPTWAHDVAAAVAAILRRLDADGADATWGTYHVADEGVTTWFGFASEIFRLAAARGAKVPRVRPITAAEYPTRAVRPRYSVLDTAKLCARFDITMPKWQESLARCLARDNPRAFADHASEVRIA